MLIKNLKVKVKTISEIAVANPRCKDTDKAERGPVDLCAGVKPRMKRDCVRATDFKHGALIRLATREAHGTERDEKGRGSGIAYTPS